ncbi:hypothetical protein J2785_007415 [Burkholderia ambifaria]|nr:hypothetical protein [Burkholderia ambifaria]
MAMGRPKAELVLSEDECSQLMSIARSRSISAALVTRARIVLAAADGEPNSAITQCLQRMRSFNDAPQRLRAAGMLQGMRSV